MSTDTITRREMIKQKEAIDDESRFAYHELIDDLYYNLDRGLIIPIIGDTVRKEKIFDIDKDKVLGVIKEGARGIDDASHSDSKEAKKIIESNEEKGSDGKPDLLKRELSITEQLAVYWAKEINYPLVDRYRMARVAQYHILNFEYPYKAKLEYLQFHKKKLLGEAIKAARHKKDMKALRQAIKLCRNVDNLTFPEIVDELNLPRLKQGEGDPLDILARMKIKYYVTTGYYDFIERALEKKGKKPRTRLCHLNVNPDELDPDHIPNDRYIPTWQEPMVYHLFGLARYPESMVLSEDDYVEFLVRLMNRPPDDKSKHFIDDDVLAALQRAALLLLGYRLHDWDFRVLFRILKIFSPSGQRQFPSLAIQLDPEEQFDIAQDDKALENATEYLTRYLKQISLKVHWGSTDDFLVDLGNHWNKKQRGG